MAVSCVQGMCNYSVNQNLILAHSTSFEALECFLAQAANRLWNQDERSSRVLWDGVAVHAGTAVTKKGKMDLSLFSQGSLGTRQFFSVLYLRCATNEGGNLSFCFPHSLNKEVKHTVSWPAGLRGWRRHHHLSNSTDQMT